MRILYHHRTRSKDGQTVHIDGLVAALRSLGHDVLIAGPRGSRRATFGSDAGAVALLKRVLPAVVYELLEICHALVSFVRLWRAYRGFRPDILYERCNLFVPAGAWLRRIYGVPFLLEVNAPLARERSEFGNLRFSGLARRAERYVWRSADHALPVSRVLADELRAGGVDDRKIVVIPNGVSKALLDASTDGSEVRRQFGIETRLVLGFCGFVRSWHGLDLVVELIARSGGRSPWHLLLLGDGPALPRLRRLVSERGISERVTFAGVVAPDRVPLHVAAFDIALQPLVVPYASPLKIFEYMALKRAIVAPDVPNIREILAHGQTALLFDPDRPGAFQHCVETLASDPQLRRTLGERAHRQLIDRNATWDGNARRVMELVNGSGHRMAYREEPAEILPLMDAGGESPRRASS